MEDNRSVTPSTISSKRRPPTYLTSSGPYLHSSGSSSIVPSISLLSTSEPNSSSVTVFTSLHVPWFTVNLSFMCPELRNLCLYFLSHSQSVNFYDQTLSLLYNPDFYIDSRNNRLDTDFKYYTQNEVYTNSGNKNNFAKTRLSFDRQYQVCIKPLGTHRRTTD